MTSNIVQTNQFVNMADAVAQSILAIDTGKTMLIPIQTAASVFTLPLPQPGLNFRFLVTGATAGTAAPADTITLTPSGGATVTGLCLNFTPGAAGAAPIAAVTKNASANVTIEAVAPRGTWINVNCDGSVWYINGVSNDIGFA